MRSLRSFVEFSMCEPARSTPEYTRTYVRRPTNGSDMILKTSPENGSESSGLRTACSPLGVWPSTGMTSTGEGRNATTESSSGWIALFLNAVPQSTGTPSFASVARRIARRSSSIVGSSSCTNFSMSDSSWSASFSNSSWWAWAAAAWYSAGMGSSSHSSPISPIQRSARISTRSMTPMKSDSVPHGSCRTSGFAARRSTIMSTVRPKSAPVRSILFTKQMRGTP